MGRRRHVVLTTTGRAGDGGRESAAAGRDVYSVLLDTPELVLLRRHHRDHPGDDEPRVLQAGEIVSRHAVLEVVSTAAACRWTGDLRIYGQRSLRVLGFQEGALRHARSDHPEDRLDKVLARVGVISPAEVESLVRELGPGQRFGELLLERRIVEQSQLFAYLRRQMEQTLLAAILVDDGCYVFLEATEEASEPPSATARIPLQSLLLGAAERLDLFHSYQVDVPDEESCPEARPGVDVTELDARQRLVLAYSDGSRSVRQIASETWLGRFQTCEVVSDLVRAGRLRLRPPQRNRADLAVRLTEPFNELLAEIQEALDGDDDVRAFRRELAAWAQTSAPAEELAELVSDGAIDAVQLAAALGNGAGRSRIEDLRDAFHELTAYALFSAGLRLPRDRETDLAARVNRRLSELGGP